MHEAELLATLKAAEDELILARRQMEEARTDRTPLNVLADLRDRVAAAELKVIRAQAAYGRRIDG